MRRVSGYPDYGIAFSCASENRAGFAGGKRIGGQMDAVGIAGQGDVNPRVDEQPGGRTAGNRLHGSGGELLKGARGEIFFTQLNVVDAGVSTLADLFKQFLLLVSRTSAKLFTVRDVVEQHGACRRAGSGLGRVAHKRSEPDYIAGGPPASKGRLVSSGSILKKCRFTCRLSGFLCWPSQLPALPGR